jgi:hypothetical protein
MVTLIGSKSKAIGVLTGYIALFLVGCDKHAGETREYTEEQVAALVRPGVPREVILAKFGQPLRESHFPEGYDVMYYIEISSKNREKDYEFGGFEVFIRDGRVVRWEPIHQTTRMPKK